MDKNLKDYGFDDQNVGQWVNAMLFMQGYGLEHKVGGSSFGLLAQCVAFYGIAAHSRAYSVSVGEMTDLQSCWVIS